MCIRDRADPLLMDVWVEGEVSNFRQAVSGHCYFTLKDAAAEVRCVMWSSAAEALHRLPADGEQVLAHGHVGVYEQRGAVQLYVDHLEPAPGRLSTQMRPPCFSTTDFTMVSPSPVPLMSCVASDSTR